MLMKNNLHYRKLKLRPVLLLRLELMFPSRDFYKIPGRVHIRLAAPEEPMGSRNHTIWKWKKWKLLSKDVLETR